MSGRYWRNQIEQESTITGLGEGVALEPRRTENGLEGALILLVATLPQSGRKTLRCRVVLFNARKNRIVELVEQDPGQKVVIQTTGMGACGTRADFSGILVSYGGEPVDVECGIGDVFCEVDPVEFVFREEEGNASAKKQGAPFLQPRGEAHHE